MSDLRARDASNPQKWRELIADKVGRLIVSANLWGKGPFGNSVEVRTSHSGLLLTGGKTFATPFIPIPGIGAGVAYAAEDAFGTSFEVLVPASGIIQSALVVDEDDENIDVDLLLFRDVITSGTDNSAFAPSLTDMLKYEGFVNLGVRGGISGSALGNNDGISKSYVAPSRKLWVQAVARGVLNMAAGTQYFISLRILADE